MFREVVQVFQEESEMRVESIWLRMMIIRIFYIFYWFFWTIPDGVQELFLALYSEMSPGSAQGIVVDFIFESYLMTYSWALCLGITPWRCWGNICGARVQTWVSYMQGKQPLP